jgi:hypothetical protein
MKLAELISKYNDSVFPQLTLTEHQRHVFNDIKNCRSPVLGGHLYVCPDCGTAVMLCNSCRNRNCPTCQDNKRQRWVENQCNDLLEIPYYHVVFTVPEVLNSLFLFRPKILYNVLFAAVWETIRAFFDDPRFLGGKGGMLTVLHSWGQTLVLHPHLHCIIPGAGLDVAGNFKIIRGKDKYLFPVKALSEVFRAKFAAELTRQAKINDFKIPATVRCMMFRQPWVVFCKRPFGNPRAVVAYLGRYTYRTAISESRILSDENGKITIAYKDYKTAGTKKTMELDVTEFFRRFALHILPKRTVKIRHFGMLSNSCKKQFVTKGAAVVGKYNKPVVANEQIETAQTLPENHSVAILCPVCKTGKLKKMASITFGLFLTGFTAVNQATGEIIYRHPSRDGPFDDQIPIMCI